MNDYPVQDLYYPQMLPDRHFEPCSRLMQLSWRPGRAIHTCSARYFFHRDERKFQMAMSTALTLAGCDMNNNSSVAAGLRRCM